MLKLPKSFRFSPIVTIVSIFLAVCMFGASRWQWQRYNYKVELIRSYKTNSNSPPLEFPIKENLNENFKNILHKKVHLSGEYDFKHQVIIINQRDKTGPGSLLLTPFLPEGGKQYFFVSRGFIPYKYRTPESWEQYSFSKNDSFQAVVQESIAQSSVFAPNSKIDKGENFTTQWLQADLQKISKQMPYQINAQVFLQRLGTPPIGQFPSEFISIRVPPSTHFGYTIEWSLLALISLVVGFAVQALPKRTKKMGARKTNEGQISNI